MKPGETVLVTGASGFIGTRLLPVLRDRGWSTKASTARLDREGLPVEGSGAIVHLAGISFVPDSWHDPVRFYQTNLIGTIRVLEHCARHKVPLVFVSSYVYGDPDELPVAEDAPRRPVNPYMHSKVLAEDSCAFYAEQLGVDVIIVRPFNIYGPGQPARFAIPTLIDQLIDPARDAVSIADGLPRRDFLFVDDLVELLAAAVGSGAAGTFNAGSGESHSIGDVHALLVEITGIDKPLADRGERRPGEIMDVVADIGLAERVLAWRPRTSLRDGLASTVEARMKALRS